MLTYEHEGFLEVESKNIKQLCRTKTSVTFGDAEREGYAVHAALCDYLDGVEQRCRVVFYAKALKRALVFAVKGPESQSAWQAGQEALAQLGFQLVDVDLKLSPAMLEVVLRDVPGLLSPAEARKERTQQTLLLAGLQAAYDKAPESAQGKKAALQLNAELHLKDCVEELRQFLQRSVAANQAFRADIEAFASQVKDLTERLETAGAHLDAERNQRQISESITAAAEKRIQELEGLLVDFETKSSYILKQKRKIIQLQGRIKKLEEVLDAAEVEAGKQREKEEHLIAEAKVADDRLSTLEDRLKETETSLAITQTELAEKQAESSRLNESLKGTELQIKALEAGLKDAEKQAAQLEQAAKKTEGVQAQLVEARQTLKNSLNVNSALEEQLANATAQSEGLKKRLRETARLARDKDRDEQLVTSLTEQNEQLAGELKALLDVYDQECGTRKRLELRAVEEDQRVRTLEDALAKVTENAADQREHEQVSAMAAREIESLRIALQEEKQRFKEERQSREGLESEIDEAHKIIDSLEKMVRDTENSARGQLSREVPGESDDQHLLELELKLKTVEIQLEQERIEQKRLSRAVAVAEKKILEQEERLLRGQAEQVERESQNAVVAKPAVQAPAKSARPLPHELRPEPKKGALFRPDWDLAGLPCQSSKQVLKAWETVFNVQTALEGYQSQYCMAYLVVLRIDKQKQLYLLYRLKQTKHTLICVPAIAPKDEPSLERIIKEGLDFLKRSGFEMDAMSTADIDNSLKTYFLEDSLLSPGR